MKVFIFFAFALSTVLAYDGPQHHTVIDKHGVPIDTVEVQKARVAHLTQLAAVATNDDYSNDESAKIQSDYSGPLYHGPQHIPVIGKNGVPVDTVEVQHARSANLSHLAAAKSHGSSEHSISSINANQQESSGLYYHGPQHYPVIDKYGVPVETVEVQHAKAAHLAATKLAAADNNDDNKHYSHEVSAPVSQEVKHTILEYHGPKHIAVIGEHGVPVDTAEVQHLRAAHLAVHESQKHRY